MRFIYLFIYFCFFAHVFFCMLVSYSVASDSLQPHGLYISNQSPLSMEFSRQEYWSGLLHCRQVLYHLRHQGYLCYGYLYLNSTVTHCILLLFLHVQSHVQSSVFKSLTVTKIINFFLCLHTFLKLVLFILPYKCKNSF